MVGPDLPEIPAPLKSLQPCLKIASTHDKLDPVVSYWCRLYALQTGLKLSTKTPKETSFLRKLMDWLETTKKELGDNEAITNNVAAQAHLENWALKLFLYADKHDRAGNFGKNVIQSFFTAGLLYDVLTVFGELSEEAVQYRKYSKWKAAYIHSCLKNGETPVPGPVGEDGESLDPIVNVEEGEMGESKEGETPNLDDLVDHGDDDSTSTERDPADRGVVAVTKAEGGVELSVEQIGKAQKFIKWAGSALNYDDVPTAVSNLRKALNVLTTGQELA